MIQFNDQKEFKKNCRSYRIVSGSWVGWSFVRLSLPTPTSTVLCVRSLHRSAALSQLSVAHSPGPSYASAWKRWKSENVAQIKSHMG